MSEECIVRWTSDAFVSCLKSRKCLEARVSGDHNVHVASQWPKGFGFWPGCCRCQSIILGQSHQSPPTCCKIIETNSYWTLVWPDGAHNCALSLSPFPLIFIFLFFCS